MTMTVSVILVVVLVFISCSVGAEWSYQRQRVLPFENRDNTFLEGRIVGGSSVAISRVPWQVSVRISGAHACGGSLISAIWVLTTAHCTDGKSASYLSIRAGSTFRSSGGQTVNVFEIVQHPSYDPKKSDYDISLLRLESALTLNTNVQPVQLPSAGASIAVGTNVFVTGWGVTNGSMSLHNSLHGVTVQIVSEESCKASYGSSAITPRMLCAGVTNGGKDACFGDAGGPLVDPDDVLVGCVSLGRGCGIANYPGVYTNVSSVRSWIQQNAEV